jgi:hypothetical protein
MWKLLNATCVPKRLWPADRSAKTMDRVFAAFGFVVMWVLLTLAVIVFGIAFLLYLAGSYALSRFALLRSSSYRRAKQLANPQDRN